jgi:hypothetical protein
MSSKPGRNDTCHCGSGKKFKKCHGLKQRKSRGSMVMLVIVSLLMVAGVAAVVSSLTSGDTGKPAGVWSAEHGHYH